MKPHNQRFSGSRPRLGVSACLLGHRVRYDGRDQRHDWLVDELGAEVLWVPVCPEVEFGLGVPREPIELVRQGPEIRLITASTGRDLTEPMQRWVAQRVAALLAEGPLCGYIFRTKSPSCGLTQVKVMAGTPDSNTFDRSGRGLFAAALRQRLPGLPMIEDHQLDDDQCRERFIAAVRARLGSL